VTLALLFCHVGQYTISIFILFSDMSNVATDIAPNLRAKAARRLPLFASGVIPGPAGSRAC